MPALKIRLLGQPQLHMGGEAITGFVTRKSQALLYYLVCNPRSQSRDTLAALFWPDASEQNAKNSLRRVLPNLRTLVGGYLHINRQEIAFDRQGDSWLDVDAFIDAATSSDARVTTDVEEIERLNRVVQLYKGDFLDGFHVADCAPFEEWVLFQREYLRGLALQCMRVLAEYHIRDENPQAGLVVTHRLLSLEPWYETGHQQQMILLAQSGQRGAALAQFEECRAMLAKEFGLQPAAETTAIYHRIRKGEWEPSRALSLQDDVFGQAGGVAGPGDMVVRDTDSIPRQGMFEGRQVELAQLSQWHRADGCSIIAIVGAGGSGKTSFAAEYARSFASMSSERPDNGGRVLWHSLVNAPPITTTLHLWLQVLSEQRLTKLPDTLDEQLALLLDYLRYSHTLLILDNLESVLKEGKAGEFRHGYEEYGVLIQQIGEMSHKSCLLLTSREMPLVVARLARRALDVRILALSGLPVKSGIDLLGRIGLRSDRDRLATLVQKYSGNPLALKLIAETILEVFSGQIDYFLEEGTLIFEDIRTVLDEQFARLPEFEVTLLVWLAIEREPVSLETLVENCVHPPPRQQALTALRSLQRRSLVEVYSTLSQSSYPSVARFTLQNVVMEYVTLRLIERLEGELGEVLHGCIDGESTYAEGDIRIADMWLNQFVVAKADSMDYIRASQVRLLLKPLVDRLRARFQRADMERILRNVLSRLRMEGTRVGGYAPATVLHIAQEMGIDLARWDFSRLCVRQADLGHLSLPAVDFSHADLTDSRFADVFTAVLDVAYSPDGEYLAAATTNGEVVLWQAGSLQPHAVCTASVAWLWSIDYSPDGSLLAAGSTDHQVYLFETQTGALVETLRVHTDGVHSVKFGPAGDLLISAGFDQTVRIWEVATGKLQSEIRSHERFLLSIAVNTTGLIASAGGEHDILLSRLTTLDVEGSLRGHSDSVTVMVFSPDGHFLASGGADHSVIVWDINSHQAIKRFLGHDAVVRSLVFHPTRQLLAVGYDDGLVRIWDYANNRVERTLFAHAAVVWSLDFSPDGSRLVSGSNDHSVRIWNVQSGECIRSLHGHNSQIWKIVSLQQDRLIVGAGGDGQVRIHDVEVDTSIAMPEVYDGILRALAVSADGRTLASAGTGRVIYIWDTESRVLHCVLQGHSETVYGLEFHPHLRVLASASGDRSVRLWDPLRGRCMAILYEPQGRISSVVFNRDGTLLAAGGYDPFVYLWDVRDCGQVRLVNKIAVDDSFVIDLAFRPAGQHLAVASSVLSEIRVWNVETGACEQILTQGHTSGLNCISFSAQGDKLASGGVDQSIIVWEMATSRPSQRLYGHRGVVRSIIWQNDDILWSSSADGTIRQWRIGTGECLQILRSRRLYAGMNISGAVGLTHAQRDALLALGAVEK